MSEAFVDTNVFIRLITGDDPVKQAAARALFRRVEAGELTLRAPETVIADAVFVLCVSKQYRLSRQLIHSELTALISLPAFKLPNRRILMRALDIFAETRLDFGDSIIIANMERRGERDLYSYDGDFDRRIGINRLEP